MGSPLSFPPHRAAMTCPDHPKALVTDAHGRSSCPFCKGVLLTETDLAAYSEELRSPLAVETREKSIAFAKLRGCPSCRAPMAPWCSA